MTRRPLRVGTFVGMLLICGCATQTTMRQEYADQLRLYTGAVRAFTQRMQDGRISAAEAETLMELKRQAREHLAAMSAAEQLGDRAAFNEAYLRYAPVMARFTAGVFKHYRQPVETGGDSEGREDKGGN